MRINNMIVENFHGFKKREITFSENFTVLIGDNGSGKTTILDGLAVGLGTFILGLDGLDSRNIKKEEVRLEKIPMGEITTMELQFPSSVTCFGEIDGENYSWTRLLDKKRGNTKGIGTKDIILYAEKLQKKVSSGEEVILPLIAYYGTGRLHLKKKEKSVRKLKPGSRLEGYIDCLDPVSNWKLVESWFIDKRLIELQRAKPLSLLESVRQAISSSMAAWKSIDYDFDQKEIVAIQEDGLKLPFSLLSDGARNMLGVVGDMAFRIANLNPHLSERAIMETPGVVLIDELDLHLHPTWQRTVIKDLRIAFPKIQFIITTHSPFIVQSLYPGELRWLQNEDDDEQVEEDQYVNRSLEDIVENVMDIPFPLAQRSDHLQEMYETAKQYYALIDDTHQVTEEEKEQLKKKLDELSAPYSENVAYYAFLERKRMIAGLERDADETN